MDLGRAPMLRACVTHDVAGDRWVLLLLQHHLTSDHTATEVLRAEIDAHLDGRADQLPAPLPFRNYVAQARLGVSRAEHGAFFREMLGDVDEPTVPFGLRDVHGDGLELEQARLAVDEELGVRLRERARALGVSAASVCHVAWALVLARVSGRSDVVFGTVLFGRMQGGEGADQVLGPFINTLPVRMRMAETGAVAGVRRTQALLASLVRHEHASLVLAQQCSGVPASEPLFSALFNYRHSVRGGKRPTARGAAPGIRVMERSNYPLTLSVDDLGDAFSLTVQVQAGVGAERVCAFMHTALGGLVAALEGAPECPLESIEVLAAAERRQVLEAWNRTEAEYPADRCIHELFEAQVARTPGAVAVRFEEESLTYRELNERANRLAHYLVRLGVGPEVRVGVLVERSLEMVVSLLAVLKAGGAYVPLDPGYPAERLAYVLDDSAVPLVLVQAALRATVPARDGIEVLAVDALADRLAGEPAENPAGGAGAESLAYVIYTSGSTGRPKGVMNQHRGVVNRLVWMQAQFGIGTDDVVLQKTPFGFDVSVWEFFWPLQQGATLVMARPDGHRDPLYLQEVIERRGVTTLHFVPSMLQQFVETAEAARCSTLRRVICSGEALPPALVARFHQRLPASAALHNLYGPTEAAVDVSHWACARDDAAGVVPIGRPVWNTRLYVLDAALQPVPVGVPGELYIGGVQVARGYQGRAAMTAERFVPDSFSTEGGARLYRTGDRVRWRTDGAIEYLGRLDFQVKVRGFRIELGEIESVLLGHPAVREAVVLARGEGEAKQLVAWIVVAAGEAPADELRAHLQTYLPGHMVPSAFVRLDALPLTRNGKVDRRALPEPDAGDLAGTRFVVPGTPTEEVLAALWTQLLGAGRVGATDDFFSLGGHSLLATRLVSRVRADLRVELPIRAVFEHSTLAAQAAEVDRLRRAAPGVEAPPLVPIPRDGDLPLSLAQERLWFVDRMEPGSATYHMPLFLRLEGELDADALRRALDELVRRHESLRTSFPLVDGAPVQRVAPPAPADLVFHDLGTLRHDERDDEAARLVREQARLPFWLETGPLFRADLVKLGEGDHLLLIVLHHAIADGWSLDVLRHELAALYGAFSRGEASPLPEPRIQYGDFSVWQRAWLQGEVLERQVAFWRRTLEGAPPLLALPADRPRRPVQTHAGALERAFLAREAADAVLALARQEGATLFMVLLAALDLVLSRQSGEDDVVVGTPVAGRTRAETDRVVGLFLNSLALRVSLAGDPAFRELLRRVRETTLDAYAHQDAPFEAVLEEIHPERAQDRTPVFQVMLNLANFAGAGAVVGDMTAADAASGFAGLRVSGVDRGVAALRSKFDLTLYAGERPDGIALHLVYNPDLFDAGRMDALLAQLVAVLEQALEDPGRPVSRFVLADGRAPSGADRELRTAAGFPAGVGEPGEVWERHDGQWASTGERGRYLPDGFIAPAFSTQEPEARTEAAVSAPVPDAGAGQTETEREMLAIWHEVLGEPVELHDDFFDLGGHSLLGVRLLALVKKRLGRTLALPVLFDASTPAALSARVDDTGEGRGFMHLVPMGNQGSELAPIFLLHPAGGTVFKYADLASHVGPDRPVYAIQAAGVTDGAEPLRTVDLMAQRYLEEVLRLQPRGPYYLAGWSAGGVITMEMAHRLRAAGHEVALVGLLDSRPPNAEKPIPDPVHLYRRLAAGLSSADLAELDALEDEIRVLPIDDRLPYLARWLGAHGAESRVQELDGLKPVVEVFRATVAATRRHPLTPYPGRVTLFCAESGRGEGWEKIGLPELWKPLVTGELEVVMVPGTHITMIAEPNVREVAAAIRAAIDRC
ncbi:MAG TPA: amino acid adenylation domain-containing protein [Longimicrobium sp.]|nr:amino acid adenylation domain-containing protein [Longimicrobium sp.]